MKAERALKWKKITSKSPFGVDLVAEDERIQEENRIRLAEEENRRKMAESKRVKAKSEIILKVQCHLSTQGVVTVS